MDSQYPYLELHKLDGTKEMIDLKTKIDQKQGQCCITIGRHQDNDLTLPDPHKKISRHHCSLEKEGGYWWIVDQGSSNGTFVQRPGQEGETDVRQDGRFKLINGDVILILGKWIEPDEPVFWQIRFQDGDETEKIKEFQAPAQFEYSLSQEKLFRVFGREREALNLRPLERNMVHYLAQRNYENGHQPTVCNYEELIAGIWGDAFGHSKNEVNRLAFGIRDKIELDSGEPQFLETVPRKGYLLNIKVVR